MLVDASGLPGPFRAHGVAATVAASFGIERLPSGLVAVTGHRLAKGQFDSATTGYAPA